MAARRAAARLQGKSEEVSLVDLHKACPDLPSKLTRTLILTQSLCVCLFLSRKSDSNPTQPSPLTMQAFAQRITRPVTPRFSVIQLSRGLACEALCVPCKSTFTLRKPCCHAACRLPSIDRTREFSQCQLGPTSVLSNGNGPSCCRLRQGCCRSSSGLRMPVLGSISRPSDGNGPSRCRSRTSGCRTGCGGRRAAAACRRAGTMQRWAVPLCPPLGPCYPPQR